MKRVDAVVIGGGQAGLATSRALGDRGVGHVVLERGRVAERWRSERWDSLTMLTPRWMSRLPGWAYRGPDPHGFMSRDELVVYLEQYARSFDAPVESGVTVTSVVRDRAGYRVATSAGTWWAPSVVIATGHSDRPRVPDFATGVDERIAQVVPSRYRRPDRLPAGGVLVVGASATGVQLASEIQGSGRPVTLAVGRHSRLPRRYRGRDILEWFDAMGVFNERADRVPNLASSRGAPSLQLVGSRDHRSIDLATLQDEGVRLVGAMVAAGGGRARFARTLGEHVGIAEQRLADQLARIDAYIASRAMDAPAAEPIRPVPVADAPAELDLFAYGIRTIVWATGFRRSYPWLHVPVLDPRGEIRHVRGVTAAPGLFAIGLHFQSRRNSSFIDGVGPDARAIARHVASHVGRPTAAAA